MSYEPIIGLEVHAQLRTQTKLFCRCENSFGKEGNSLTCNVCLGMPGALPVLNQESVKYAIQAGLALNCTIHNTSVFARKNYFYPDLPKGYQISQFDRPLCTKGRLTIDGEDGSRDIGITRIHMEEDAGKLLHDDSPIQVEGSLVDLNRAGVPLIEIVGEPELRTGKEASEYLKKLRSILRYVNISEADMEKGHFRCDANVSVRPKGQEEFGTKVEVKNMNSFRHVQKAIDYEIERQITALGNNEEIYQETRLWNPSRGVTAAMRSKEEAHDYRYFPEPDLLPLEVSDGWIGEIRDTLPELPDDRKTRFEEEFKLPSYDAGVLTAEKDVADFYEETLKNLGTPSPERAKAASNFLMAEVLRLANERNEDIEQMKIQPKSFAKLLKLKEEGKISGKIAKDVIDEMAETGANPEKIIEEKGLSQISNPEEIRKIVQDVIKNNPQQLEQLKGGKDKLFGFFVGQVMKATKGKANPGLVNQLLKEEI